MERPATHAMRFFASSSRVSFLIVAVLASVVGGCGSEAAVGERTDAFCKNGITPGCDTCQAACDSPKGGYQSCWNCKGDVTQKACAPSVPGNCGSDGAPISVESDPSGHPTVVSAHGRDGVTRSIRFTRPAFRKLLLTNGQSFACVPDGMCGCVDRIGRCHFPNDCDVSTGGGFLPQSACNHYPANYVQDTRMDYSDSLGRKLTVEIQLYPAQSGARMIFSNDRDWVETSVLNGTEGRISSSFAATQSFAVNMASDFPPKIQVQVASRIPEVNYLNYFHNYFVRTLHSSGWSSPAPPSSPGWYRYWGDGVIGVLSYAIGAIALDLVGPELLAVAGVLTLVGVDVWQNESAVRDHSWEAILNPLCAGARALDFVTQVDPGSALRPLTDQYCR